MNPNRLLRQNGLLAQQNNTLNTSLNNAVHRMRSVEHELEEHKIRLANALKDSGSALEHKTLSNATARALSAEQQLEDHKNLLSNALKDYNEEHKTLSNARALSAEKQLQEHKT